MKSTIEEESESVENWSERMDEIMRSAVDKAIEENRQLGLYADTPQATPPAIVAEPGEEK